MPNMIKVLEMEHAEFERRKKELEESLKAMDDAFQKWKEEVLIFEHSEYSSDDDSGSDDRVWDGEPLWTGEDEDDIQRSAEPTDRESEIGCGVIEERGNED